MVNGGSSGVGLPRVGTLEYVRGAVAVVTVVAAAQVFDWSMTVYGYGAGQAPWMAVAHKVLLATFALLAASLMRSCDRLQVTLLSRLSVVFCLAYGLVVGLLIYDPVNARNVLLCIPAVATLAAGGGDLMRVNQMVELREFGMAETPDGVSA